MGVTMFDIPETKREEKIVVVIFVWNERIGTRANMILIEFSVKWADCINNST